jgi:hypothetical protein
VTSIPNSRILRYVKDFGRSGMWFSMAALLSRHSTTGRNRW